MQLFLRALLSVSLVLSAPIAASAEGFPVRDIRKVVVSGEGVENDLPEPLRETSVLDARNRPVGEVADELEKTMTSYGGRRKSEPILEE